MPKTKYQVQRRPMFASGAEFKDYLKPFSSMQSAILCAEDAEQEHLGYEWRIKPLSSVERGTNNENQQHVNVLYDCCIDNATA